MDTEFCCWCGKPGAEGDHGYCAGRLAMIDPPRHCGACGRRMVVQVTPSGWSARCSRHGEHTSAPAVG
ncbi:hypothetical protein BC739_002810 [Kutzneria viridogrisea]|uniref:Biotin synthase auxiliary protein n=1 Tax=Kutzneria viridogrisea TaxID=47990 RepID=A0ABR6BFZ0_9PSEU|nr:hypothetical protein [Kutzneria albida]MBA8925611.1 hypothetical protein [Kutzneria viridogrisea]